MRNNIYLIGPMGVGKTTIGRILARRLGMEFADADYEIEHRTGVSIATIFDIEGEEGFRQRESGVVQELADRSGIVLATGGGAVLAEANRRVMRDSGLVIYLRAPIDILVERTRSAKHRPLLQRGDPKQVLESLLAVRGPIYEAAADLVMDTDRRAPSTIAGQLVKRIHKKWKS